MNAVAAAAHEINLQGNVTESDSSSEAFVPLCDDLPTLILEASDLECKDQLFPVLGNIFDVHHVKKINADVKTAFNM